MKAANPGVVPFTLDKKNYDQKNDVSTVQTFLLIITNEDVPQERVYKLTKTIYDNLGDFAGAVKAFERVKVANATGDMGAPRHAGMDQYLKEKGLLK